MGVQIRRGGLVDRVVWLVSMSRPFVLACSFLLRGWVLPKDEIGGNKTHSSFIQCSYINLTIGVIYPRPASWLINHHRSNAPQQSQHLGGIGQSTSIRHRHDLIHNLLPSHHSWPADHELAQGLDITVFAVLCVPELNLHRAQRRSKISAFVLVVQQVGLADGTGDLGVGESVDGPCAAVNLEFEQLLRIQLGRRGSTFVIRVDQARRVCQTGSFRHGAGLERLGFPPLVELAQRAGRHGPLLVFAEAG